MIDTISINLRLGVACMLLASSTLTLAAPDLPPYSRGYDPARDPFADSHGALDLARKTGRRVLIELGGDWCQWCLVLERFLTRNTQVDEQLHRHFVLLKINVSEDNDNADFLAGLPPNLGYPHMYVSRSDGQIIHSQDTAEFLREGRYDAQRILAFIERWRTPQTAAGTTP